MSDVDVIDDLVFELLEAAARKLCVPSWPPASPPPKSPDVPVIEARRDDDGVLGVFRFATVVEDAADVRAHFEIKLSAAADFGDGVVVGDEVGVELPLHVLCAIALADLENGGLSDDLADDVAKSGLKDALIARLSLLRGPPPSSPELSELRALVTRFGGDVVRWTMSVQADEEAVPAPLPERLVVCLERDDSARLLVIDAVRGQLPRRQLLAAIAPAPADNSFWRVLEREGPRLIGGDAVHVRKVEIDGDGVVKVDGKLLDVDVGALLSIVDDEARARLDAAASVFHKRLAARAKEHPRDPLVGAAVLRVLARAVRGTALEARMNTELGIEDAEDGSFVVDVHGRVLRLVPADDALFVDVGGEQVLAAQRGLLLDGDVEAFRAVCAAISEAMAGSDADVDLVFVDDDGTEQEQKLSAWLKAFGENDVTGWLAPNASAARAWQDVVDVLLDER